MGKEAAFLSALHIKKKPMKKSEQLFNKIFDYLKSDTYMFEPLYSSRFSVVPTGEYSVPDVQKKKLVTTIVDYLKADTYMYAPLVISQPWELDSLHLSKGPVPAIQEEEMDRKRCSDVLKGGTGKADHEAAGRNTVNVVSKDHNMDGFRHTRRSPMVTHTTRVRRETVKHMVYQNC